jgi:hypothetical protein
MAEDKELLSGEKLFNLGHFLLSDGRDGIALFLFDIALEQDAGGGFESRKH